MEQLFEELVKIEQRFTVLDNVLMISEEGLTYELEYEYLRGKRDMLLHLIRIYTGE